jgi:hypothetical protein
MGTIWHRSDFEEPKNKTERVVRAPKDPDVLFYPHALLTSPNNLFKQIKKDFEATKPRIAGGDYIPGTDEEIVDTSELSYEEFREFFSTFQQGLGVGGK